MNTTTNQFKFKPTPNNNGSCMRDYSVGLFSGKDVLATVTGGRDNRVLIPYNKARIFDAPSVFSMAEASRVASILNKGSRELPTEIIHLNI